MQSKNRRHTVATSHSNTARSNYRTVYKQQTLIYINAKTRTYAYFGVEAGLQAVLTRCASPAKRLGQRPRTQKHLLRPRYTFSSEGLISIEKTALEILLKHLSVFCLVRTVLRVVGCVNYVPRRVHPQKLTQTSSLKWRWSLLLPKSLPLIVRLVCMQSRS